MALADPTSSEEKLAMIMKLIKAILKDPRPQRSLPPLAQDTRLPPRLSAETAFNSSDRVTGHPASGPGTSVTDVVNQLSF